MLLQDLTRPHLSAFSARHTGKNTNEVILTFCHSLSKLINIFDIRVQYCAIKVNVTRIVSDILQHYVMRKEEEKIYDNV